METLFRRRFPWHLISVCTVCICTTKRTLGSYGLRKITVSMLQWYWRHADTAQVFCLRQWLLEIPADVCILHMQSTLIICILMCLKHNIYLTIYFKTLYSLRGAFSKPSSQKVNNNSTHFDPIDPKSEPRALDYTTCPCSTQISMNLILLANSCCHLYINQQDKYNIWEFLARKNIYFQRLSIYEQWKSSS